jgi:sugar fermentation stimulation protein A
MLTREARDAGSYLLVLRLPGRRTLPVGSLGDVTFRAGYYIYVGSAKKNLARRIQRHHRLRKNLFWHIDYLRDAADWVAALPIRTADDIECALAGAMEKTASWLVPTSAQRTVPVPLTFLEWRPILSFLLPFSIWWKYSG